MSEDKRKKRNPPNYKFLGGEAEETGDPLDVFMRPE